jgi:hypothetical protein
MVVEDPRPDPHERSELLTDLARLRRSFRYRLRGGVFVGCRMAPSEGEDTEGARPDTWSRCFALGRIATGVKTTLARGARFPASL